MVEATRAGALQIVQYLLSRGAQDTDNKALILAADLNYDKIIRIFLMRLVFPDNEYKINKKNIDLGQVSWNCQIFNIVDVGISEIESEGRKKVILDRSLSFSHTIFRFFNR